MISFEGLVEESAQLVVRAESGEPLRELTEEAKKLEAVWRDARRSEGYGPKNLHKLFEANLKTVFDARNRAWAEAAGAARAVVAEAAELANWAGSIYTHYAADLRDRFFASGDIGPTRKQLRAELEAAIAAAFATLPRKDRRDGGTEAGDEIGPDDSVLEAAEQWAALEHAGRERSGRRNRR